MTDGVPHAVGTATALPQRPTIDDVVGVDRAAILALPPEQWRVVNGWSARGR